MSNRERARLAWRARVDAAARGLRASLDAWRDAGFLVPVENEMTGGVFRFREPEATNYHKAYAEFRAALSAPKPWASKQRRTR